MNPNPASQVHQLLVEATKVHLLEGATVAATAAAVAIMEHHPLVVGAKSL